jgi:hypothetical protein
MTGLFIPEFHENRSSGSEMYWLLITFTGWYRAKRPMQLRPFSDALCSPSEFWSFPIHPPEFYATVAVYTPRSEAGRTLARNIRELCLSVSLLSLLKEHLTCRQTLRHGPAALLLLRKKSCYGLDTLKNPSLLAECEPANLWFNGKHDNHYTTEND